MTWVKRGVHLPGSSNTHKETRTMAPTAAQGTKRVATAATDDGNAQYQDVKRSKVGISVISSDAALDAETIRNDIFYKGLLDDSSADELSTRFFASKPYLHCAIDKLVNEDLLRLVRDEILSQLHFTVKETDIYKVNQTGDLANLDGLPANELEKLKSLKRLRDGMYSKTFREFVSRITHCGPLSGENADMSINNYTRGCHLLNHDDVIGTRRVSYILYLPNPDEEWKQEYGGALELYPVMRPGAPESEPSVVIPPKWNQMVFFTVQPGHSFHSVEEVVAQNKDRLSISGWFHIPNPGEEGHDEVAAKYNDPSLDSKAKPSAQQLEVVDEAEAGADVDDVAINYKFEPFSNDIVTAGDDDDFALENISEEHMAMLEKYISPLYLDLSAVEQMLQKFVDESSIQIENFLKPELAEKFALLFTESDEADNMTDRSTMTKHGAGCVAPWKIRGPAHKWRHAYVMARDRLSDPNVDSASARAASALCELMEELFESGAMSSYLKLITGLTTLSRRGMARRLRPGLDYTLATANNSLRVLDATLCFSGMAEVFKGKNGKMKIVPDEDWDGEDVGGYQCYMAPHTGAEDPAVYRQMDEDGALLTLPCGFNTLTLVLCDVGLMKFTKYVSASAPGSRWDVVYEFTVPEDDDDDDTSEAEDSVASAEDA